MTGSPMIGEKLMNGENKDEISKISKNPDGFGPNINIVSGTGQSGRGAC